MVPAVTIIGSAEVVIKAITTGIAADIKKGLADARPTIATEGEQAGSAYASGFSSRSNTNLMSKGITDSLHAVEPDVSRAGSDHGASYSGSFNTTVGRQIPNAINSALSRGGGGRGASSAGNRDGSSYANAVTKRIEAALKVGLGNPFNAPLFNSGQKDASAYNRGFLQAFDRKAIEGVFSTMTNNIGKFMAGGFNSALSAANNSFLSMFAMVSVLGPAIATLVGALGALAGGLFTVVGAAVQAGGALAAIPVGFLALAQGAGVAIVATKGVTAAIKASIAQQKLGTTATKAATDNSAAIAAKANAIADAQKQIGRTAEDNAKRMRDANQSLSDSEKDLGRVQQDNASKLADANQKVVDSDQAVQQAHRDVAQAQLDLNDAYKAGAESLQQLNFDAEDAALAEEDAGIRLQKARENMLKTRADPGASALDKQEADLEFKQADLNYRRSKDRAQDLAKTQADANKQGVSGTQEVIDAKNKVTDAQTNEQKAVSDQQDAEKNLAKVRMDNARSYQDALEKVAKAQQDISDTQKQNARATADAAEALRKANEMQIKSGAAANTVSSAQNKVNQAYKDLGKNQTAFAKSVVASLPAWKSFKDSLGENMFAGASTAWDTFTKSITGTGKNATAIGKQLQGTATIMGDLGKQTLGMFTQGTESAGLFAKLMKGNNDILETFTKKNANGKSAFQSFGLVILRVLTAAQPMVKDFAVWLSGLATKWEESTRAGSDGSGKLVTFFKNAEDAVKDWATIFGNFGTAIKNMFEASKDARGNFMTDLKNLSQKFKDFTEQAGNDTKMSKWFSDTYENSKQIIGLFGEIGKALINVADNPAIGVAFKTLSTNLSGTLTSILDPMIAQGPQLAEMFQSVGGIIKALTSGGGLHDFLKTLTSAFTAIGDFLAVPAVQRILEITAPIAAFMAAARVVQIVIGQLTKPLSGILLAVQTILSKGASVVQTINSFGSSGGSAAKPSLPGVVVAGSKAAKNNMQPTPIVSGSVAAGITNTATAVTNVGTTVSKSTKLLTTFGKVAGAVGKSIPFVGTAIALASVAFDLWGGKSKDASAETKAFNDTTANLTSTLDPVTGALTAATREMAITQDAASGLQQKYRDLGLNVTIFEQAALGNKDALVELNKEVENGRVSVIQSTDAYKQHGDILAKAGISAQQMSGAFKDSANGPSRLQEQVAAAGKAGLLSADEMTAANLTIVNAFNQSKDGVAKYDEAAANATKRSGDLAATGKDIADKYGLAQTVLKGVGGTTTVLKGNVDLLVPSLGKFETITDKVRTANSKFDAVIEGLQSALDTLRGRTPGYSEAMSAYGDAITTMGQAFKTGEKGALEFDKAAVNSDGSINFLNENGRTLNDTLTDMQSKTVAAAKAAFDQAGGTKNLAAAQKAANKVVDDSNTSMGKFIDSLGLGTTKTNGLKDTLGTVPKSVVTDIVVATQQASEDLANFVYDQSGKVIGVKAQADTKPAATDMKNWVTDEEGKLLYRKVGADTKIGEGQIAQFVTDQTTGEVIGLKVVADPAAAKTTIQTYRDAESKKVLSLKLDADKAALVASMTDIQKDAKGNPLVWNTVVGKDAQGKDVVDAYVKKKDGTKIDLGIVTTVTTTAAPPDLGTLKKAGGGNKFLMQPVATGGYISGPGGPTDDMIPAWLSNGEFVIRAAMVRRYGRQLLEKFNRGMLNPGGGSGIPGFKDGGLAAPRKTADYLSNVMSLSNKVGHSDTFTVKTVAVPPNKDIEADWVGLSQIPWVPKVEVGVDAINVTRNTEWTTFMTALTKFFKGLMTPGNIPYTPTAGVEQWRSLVVQALKMTNQPASYADIVLHQMQTESSGNPNAINLTDINAQKGTPSKGLLQVIDPTFQAYKYPGYDNIWDPLSNILASIRYVLGRYGSIPAGMRGLPYDTGGILNNRSLGINMSGRPERVLTPAQTTSFDRLVNAITTTSTSAATQTGGVATTPGSLSARDRQMISAIAGGVAAQQNTMQPTVRVFIGEQELRGIVSSELLAYDKGTARVISLGKKP